MPLGSMSNMLNTCAGHWAMINNASTPLPSNHIVTANKHAACVTSLPSVANIHDSL